MDTWHQPVRHRRKRPDAWWSRFDPHIVIKLTTILTINGWQIERYVQFLKTPDTTSRAILCVLLATVVLSIFLATLRIVANVAVQLWPRGSSRRHTTRERVVRPLRKIDSYFWLPLVLLTINMGLQVFDTMPLMCANGT